MAEAGGVPPSICHPNRCRTRTFLSPAISSSVTGGQAPSRNLGGAAATLGTRLVTCEGEPLLQTKSHASLLLGVRAWEAPHSSTQPKGLGNETPLCCWTAGTGLPRSGDLLPPPWGEAPLGLCEVPRKPRAGTQPHSDSPRGPRCPSRQAGHSGGRARGQRPGALLCLRSLSGLACLLPCGRSPTQAGGRGGPGHAQEDSQSHAFTVETVNVIYWKTITMLLLLHRFKVF